MGPRGDYTLDAFAADIAHVAASFDARPALVGASLGGISSMVAIADAGGGTELASSLTLVDVAHRIEVAGRERIGDFMTAARRLRHPRRGGRRHRRLQPAPAPARRTCPA